MYTNVNMTIVISWVVLLPAAGGKDSGDTGRGWICKGENLW